MEIPLRKSKRFKESALAHELLDGLTGLQIGGSAHNDFGLRCLNVDYCGDMDTIFKKHEIELCGEALPVDIVAPGDDIPAPDKSFDFVISSHVIEHFFDPIGAIKEWVRIARKYVYIICPLRDALPSDVDKPLTPIDELFLRHEGLISTPEVDTHEHYTRWTLDSFCEMCDRAGFFVSHTQDIDDKVGNGFTVVIDTTFTSTGFMETEDGAIFRVPSDNLARLFLEHLQNNDPKFSVSGKTPPSNAKEVDL